jgi:hypothetical protein
MAGLVGALILSRHRVHTDHIYFIGFTTAIPVRDVISVVLQFSSAIRLATAIACSGVLDVPISVSR